MNQSGVGGCCGAVCFESFKFELFYSRGQDIVGGGDSVACFFASGIMPPDQHVAICIEQGEGARSLGSERDGYDGSGLSKLSYDMLENGFARETLGVVVFVAIPGGVGSAHDDHARRREGR